MKEQLTKITSNPIGAIAGAVAGFLAAKKLGKVENKWMLIGATIVAGVAGALVQAKIKARKGVPTAATIKK